MSERPVFERPVIVEIWVDAAGNVVTIKPLDDAKPPLTRTGGLTRVLLQGVIDERPSRP